MGGTCTPWSGGMPLCRRWGVLPCSDVAAGVIRYPTAARKMLMLAANVLVRSARRPTSWIRAAAPLTRGLVEQRHEEYGALALPVCAIAWRAARSEASHRSSAVDVGGQNIPARRAGSRPVVEGGAVAPLRRQGRERHQGLARSAAECSREVRRPSDERVRVLCRPVCTEGRALRWRPSWRAPVGCVYRAGAWQVAGLAGGTMMIGPAKLRFVSTLRTRVGVSMCRGANTRGALVSMSSGGCSSEAVMASGGAVFGAPAGRSGKEFPFPGGHGVQA